MKRYILVLMLVLCLVGCSTFHVGKQQSKETKQAAKIEAIVDKQNNNSEAIMNQIGSLSYGVDYSLSLINQPPKEVGIAKDLNGRILSLSGMPSVSEVKQMEQTIDNLRTNLANGTKLLAVRDKQIEQIQKEKTDLQNKLELETKNYMLLAKETAQRADATQVQLDSYKGWFGLKAVFLGLKQFVFTSFWILVGVIVLFLILRIAAASNPIASAVFGVFEQVVSWAVNTIRVLFPKALQFAGHIPLPVFESYKQTLVHVVDCAQLLKEKNANASLFDLFQELDKAMDSTDKARIVEIKKELNWK